MGHTPSRAVSLRGRGRQSPGVGASSADPGWTRGPGFIEGGSLGRQLLCWVPYLSPSPPAPRTHDGLAVLITAAPQSGDRPGHRNSPTLGPWPGG